MITLHQYVNVIRAITLHRYVNVIITLHRYVNVIISLHRYVNVIRASKSPFANMLKEYVNAERAGQDNGHGECWRYYKACPKSLFMSSQENKYS
jgi:hypothetical protein